MTWDKFVHEGEQISLKNFQDEFMSVRVEMGDQSRSLMAA